MTMTNSHLQLELIAVREVHVNEGAGEEGETVFQLAVTWTGAPVEQGHWVAVPEELYRQACLRLNQL